MNATPEPTGDERPFAVRTVGLGGVLDDAIRLWKRNFRVIALLVVLVLTPLQTIIDFAMTALSASIHEAAPPDSFVVADFFLMDSVSLVLNTVFSAALVSTAYEAVLTHLLAQDYMGGAPRLSASWRAVRGRIFALFLIHIPFYLAYSLLSAFCLIPGLLFYAVFILRIPVTILEGGAVLPSFVRAVRLMAVQWHVAILILFVLMSFYLPLDFATGAATVPLVGTIAYNALSNLVGSIEVAAVTVFYFSCRTKRENVDLDLLARAVDTEDTGAHVL